MSPEPSRAISQLCRSIRLVHFRRLISQGPNKYGDCFAAIGYQIVVPVTPQPFIEETAQHGKQDRRCRVSSPFF